MTAKAAVTLLLLGLFAYAPPLAQAHHRDYLLNLASATCPDINIKTISSDKKWDALMCALPIIRQQAGRSPIGYDPTLGSAASGLNMDMMKCGLGPSPCGHSVTYQAQQWGYFSDPNCDQLSEIYQSFPYHTSARRMLSAVLHHARFSRLLRQGRWRDYGMQLSPFKTASGSYRLYLTMVFGRRCVDKYTPAPSYTKPPPPNLLAPTDDDLRHEKNNGTFKYHVIYAWASDRPNRFGLFRDQINSDVIKASYLPLPPGEKQRSIRFDIGNAEDPNAVDITGQQLPFTRAELGGGGMIYQKLQAFFKPTWDWGPGNPGRHKNLLVYIDTIDLNRCGTATVGWSKSRDPLVNWGNNQLQIAVVYLEPNFDPKVTDRFADLRCVQHEVGHNLGALGSDAPHAFDGSHCNDAYEDVLCYPMWYNSSGQIQQTPGQLPTYNSQANNGAFWDFGHDDYWDPVGGQLPWWTTNLSRFVCPDVNCTPDGSDKIGF